MWTAAALAISGWFSKVDWARVIGICLIPLVLWLMIAGLYMAGMNNGKSQIQAKWDAAGVAQQKQMNILQGEINQKEAVHTQETVGLSDQLKKAQTQHDQAVAALNTEHALRMRQSTARGAVYQREADAGGDQSRDLASHATELDGALEEGIGLVGELQEALGQREDELKLLGAQIVSDHKLVDDQ